LTYEAQLTAKRDIVRDCLSRIAGLNNVPEFQVHPSPAQWRYRARATWQLDPDSHAIGYYEAGSRRVCDVADCAVLVGELQATLERVRQTSWDEQSEELKHLDAVVGDNGVSVAPEFLEYQTREVSVTVAAETYSFNARAFFQINQGLVPSMLASALNNFTGDMAIDLYCGVGLFTLPLARRFERVVGVEANPTAARFARRNLEQAGLQHATVVTGPVAEWARQKHSQIERVDFVLLDPPRAGAESVAIKAILDLRPQRICYVSCDPATLARDLKKLLAGGYVLDSLVAFDMFPQTHHVETIVQLTR
jgi:23S rRNA (uracil1939-C5)-methyltransferase